MTTENETPPVESIEDLETRLDAARQRKAQEERDARDREVFERQAAARKVELEARRGVLAAIVEAMQASVPPPGTDVATLFVNDVGSAIYINGEHLHNLAIETPRARGSSFVERVTIGNYGNRKTYPRKANGSFNYAGIAKEMWNRLASERLAETCRQSQELLRQQEADTRERNAAAFESVKELDWKHGLRLTPSSKVDGGVVVKISSEYVVLLPEQVRRLAAMLAEFGIK